MKSALEKRRPSVASVCPTTRGTGWQHCTRPRRHKPEEAVRQRSLILKVNQGLACDANHSQSDTARSDGRETEQRAKNTTLPSLVT